MSSPETIPPAHALGAFMLHLAQDPDAPAIRSEDGQSWISRKGLGDLVTMTGRCLVQLGAGADDRAVLVAAPGPLTSAALVGLSAHLVVCPVAHGPAAELDRTARWLGARFLVVPDPPDPELARTLAAAGVEIVTLRPDPDRGFGHFRLSIAGRPVPDSGPVALPLAGADNVALILPTSGTTGKPKQVALTHRHLGHMAQSAARTLALSPADICVNPMPMHHIHGIAIGTFLPLASGGSTVPLAAPSGEAVIAAAQRTQATWYTAVPTLHQDVVRAAMANPPDRATLRLRFARSSSSAMAASTRNGLRQHLGVPVLEGLGMTEAASWVVHQDHSGDLRHGTLGRGRGVEIGIVDATGSICQAPGSIGEMVIRGPNVITSYLDDPDPAARFVDGWLRTGDLVRISEAGEVSVVGRLKELVNRGGATIAPVEVEDALLSHPAVAQAMAFGVPHPTLGQELAACVVLRPDATAAEPDIRHWIAAQLAPEKRPRRILTVAAIPLNRIGKPERIRAADILRDALQGDRDDPVGMAEAILADIFAELLPGTGVGRSTDLFLAGADSLLMLRLQLRIEEVFGTSPTPDDLTDHPTIRDLAELVMQQASPETLALLAALWADTPRTDAT